MSEETFTLTPKGLLYSAGMYDRAINEAVGELTRYCMQHGCGLAIVDGQLRFVTLTREPGSEDGVDGIDRIDRIDEGKAAAVPVPEDEVVAMVRMPVGLGDLVKLCQFIEASHGAAVKMRERPRGWLSFVKEVALGDGKQRTRGRD